MTRVHNLLTSRFVATVTKDGRYADGGGLSLFVRKRSSQLEKLWLFRYKRGERDAAKETRISLGSARDVTLLAARELARCCRQALADGKDPKTALKLVKSTAPTFGKLADGLVDDIASGFKSEITVRNWRHTLGETYCKSIRGKPVDKITTDDIVDLLRPIWQSKPETATKVRERIERVLDAAKVKGLREGENPARWKGHLKLILPAQTAKKGHYRALPWQELPSFIAKLRNRDSVSALALEWTILTCARTNMTIGCPRNEVDREAKVWTVPAERMKENREHRVPLASRCIEIFDEMERFEGGGGWLFPARDPSKTISNMAMAECLRQLGVNATVHGFRSTFSDWAHDATEFARELSEAALAHVVGDEVERAYRRSDALERRRRLMDDWARYCSGDFHKAT